MCPGRRWPATASCPPPRARLPLPISPPTKTTPTPPTTEPNSLLLTTHIRFPPSALSGPVVSVNSHLDQPSLVSNSRDILVRQTFRASLPPSSPSLLQPAKQELQDPVCFLPLGLLLASRSPIHYPQTGLACPPSSRQVSLVSRIFPLPNWRSFHFGFPVAPTRHVSALLQRVAFFFAPKPLPPFPTFSHTFSVLPKHHIRYHSHCLHCFPTSNSPVSTDSNILDLHIQNGTYLDFSRHPRRRWPRPFRRSLLCRVQGGRPPPDSQPSQLRRLGPGHPHH